MDGFPDDFRASWPGSPYYSARLTEAERVQRLVEEETAAFGAEWDRLAALVNDLDGIHSRIARSSELGGATEDDAERLARLRSAMTRVSRIIEAETRKGGGA